MPVMLICSVVPPAVVPLKRDSAASVGDNLGSYVKLNDVSASPFGRTKKASRSLSSVTVESSELASRPIEEDQATPLPHWPIKA